MRYEVLERNEVAAELRSAQVSALAAAAEAVYDDLFDSETVPYDTGHLERDTTRISYGRLSDGAIEIRSDAEYAVFVYFRAEWYFNQSWNRAAGALWFDTYINGEKRGMFHEEYARALEELLEGAG